VGFPDNTYVFGGMQVERSGSELYGSNPDAFRVRNLAIEVELNAVLRAPGDHNADMLEKKWNKLVEKIMAHMSGPGQETGSPRG